MVVGHVQRRMKARLADVEGIAQQPLVELLDVEQLNLELQAPPIHRSRQQAVKGERVVGAC